MGKTTKKIGRFRHIHTLYALLRQHYPIVCILLVWFVFAHPYFLFGHMPFPTRFLADFFPPWNIQYGMPVHNNAMPDVITQIYPWKQLVIETWQSGQIPYWNPYQFSGNALLANYQSGVFAPINIVFFLFSFNTAWSLAILAQPLLAGLGMYLYTRQLGISRIGTGIASLGFMFSGFMTVWMAYGTLGFAVLYLPYLLYAIDRLRIQNDLISKFMIVFCIPASLFSGHFQSSVYIILFSLCYAIVRYFNHKDRVFVLHTFLYSLIGGVIALPQLLPTMAFYNQSIRSELFSAAGAIDPHYLMTLFAPDFYGNPVTRNDWFGYYAEWSSYTGVLSLVLASVLISRNASIIQKFYGMAFGITLLFAVSSPATHLLSVLRLPIFSTSIPSRIIVLSSFCLAVLAGFGIDKIRQLWRENHRRVFVVCSIWIGIVGLLWFMLYMFPQAIHPELGGQTLQSAMRNMVLPTGIVLLSISLFFIKTRLSAKYVGSSILCILLIIMALDMLRFSMKWMPFEEKEFLYPRLPVTKYLQEHAGLQRVFGNMGNEYFGSARLQGIEGYDPLYSNRYGELIQSAREGVISEPQRSVVTISRHGAYTKKLFDLLGVRYIFQSKSDGRAPWVFPFWEYDDTINQTPVYSDDHYEIFENASAYDRAYIVHDYIVRKDNQAIIDTMFADTTDMREAVVLEEDVQPLDKCETKMSSTATITAYTPSEIRIETHTECPGYLVLTDTYDPGWHVRVNDTPAQIVRANYAFRAVEIPAGESTLYFSYENRHF